MLHVTRQERRRSVRICQKQLMKESKGSKGINRSSLHMTNRKFQ